MVAVTLTYAEREPLFRIRARHTEPPCAEPLRIVTESSSPLTTLAEHLYFEPPNSMASG